MLSDATVGVTYVDPHGLSEPAKHSHGSEEVSLALGRQHEAVSVDRLVDWNPRRAPSIFKILQAFSMYLDIDMQMRSPSIRMTIPR